MTTDVGPGLRSRPQDRGPHRSRRVPTVAVALVCCALLLGGCTASGPTPGTATRAADSGGSAASWAQDVQAIVDAREGFHPDPYATVSRERYRAAAAELTRRLPSLTREQALVELLRLAVLPGLAGREGHTGIFPWIPGSGTHAYPLKFWQFPQGLVVTDAREPNQDLVGWRLVAVQDRPLEQVLDLVDPLVPRDNEANLSSYRPMYLMVSELLVGLGVLDRVGPVRLELEDPGGHRRTVSVSPVSADDQAGWLGDEPTRLPPGEPLWLSRQDDVLWWRFLRPGTLYVQFNSVQSGIDLTSRQIVDRAARPDVTRVVIDIRQNGGGDNTTYGPLLSALQQIAKTRRLYVIVGRATFSAAANFATELERSTRAVFVGEPMGGSPNLYGDVTRVDLVRSGQSLFMATRYWEMGGPTDHRVTIEPALPAVLAWDDYRARRDPALDAVTADS